MDRVDFWRFVSGVCRFGGLRIAERLRDGLPARCIRERTFCGGRLRLDIARSATHMLLYLEGEGFVEELRAVSGLLKPGMTAVDVGANIGYYLLMIERVVGASGGVVCIEPSVENLPELRANIDINGFSNVRVHPVALGAETAESGFRSGINGGMVAPGEGAYTIEVTSLDDLVEPGEKIDFLKIDVEGYEGRVLDGATRVLSVDRPALFLEMHPHILPRFGDSTSRIVDLVSRYYDRIELLEIRRRDGVARIFDKVATRYLNADPMVPVGDHDGFIAACDAGGIGHTFWVVARP